jgi:hypothetical protein
MTATEAAALLGESRKTYYKWEQRGVAALLEGLGEKPSGRPETELQHTAQTELEKQLLQLRRDNEFLQKKLQLKELAHRMQLKTNKTGAKKK